MVSSMYVFWRPSWPQAQESHLPPPPSATTPSSVVIAFLIVVLTEASETKHVKCILGVVELAAD